VTDGRPLLLRGNVSEILPNLMLQAELADSTLEYAPCLSLMDGSLTEAEGILDLSDYGFLLQLWTETDGAYDAPIFCGTWYTRLMDDQNQIRMLKLILHEGGMVEYTYGSPEKEILEGFSGTWQEDGTLLRLDLYGGPIGSWNGEEQPEGYNYALIGAFEWDYQSGFLVLSHAEGDPLFYTGEIPYGWYEFLPFDAYKLAGSWVAATDYRDWEYRLNLLENGECHLDITEYGQELTCYAGWWTEADGLLELSVGLQSGQHPENPEWTALSGSYRAERSGDTLTLDFESGSILTLDMEGYGWESFVLE